MQRMSVSGGRATSAGALRPKATAHNSRALTQELGKARDLPELLSLEERHGGRFDHFNLGAFWSIFKKLPRGELSGLRDRLAPCASRRSECFPR